LPGVYVASAETVKRDLATIPTAGEFDGEPPTDVVTPVAVGGVGPGSSGIRAWFVLRKIAGGVGLTRGTGLRPVTLSNAASGPGRSARAPIPTRFVT
jgi:hypothetical protein